LANAGTQFGHRQQRNTLFINYHHHHQRHPPTLTFSPPLHHCHHHGITTVNLGPRPPTSASTNQHNTTTWQRHVTEQTSTGHIEPQNEDKVSRCHVADCNMDHMTNDNDVVVRHCCLYTEVSPLCPFIPTNPANDNLATPHNTTATPSHNDSHENDMGT
jgi:hypothetical protein